ncbi:MAG: hypothetical protein CVU65_17175 [Deltaproteobacteria bacterium HGW-Deltaproteobacteria-22]|nr:MAG: hypothetical protein CVU65_17175 [Deltaproteobacteria bacterium HGW-Deltaproteobacteria-22]
MRTPVCLILASMVLSGACQKTPPARQNLSHESTGGSAAGMPVTPPPEPHSKKLTVTPPVTPPAPTPAPPPAPGTATDPACVPAPDVATSAKMYPWPRRAAAYESWCARFPAPAGYARQPAAVGTYAHWLRHLPALPVGTSVKDYQGNTLFSATVMTVSVIDLDVGKEDLQQCMDTIMRLRGEYHWSRGAADRVKFRYAGGLYFGFSDWQQGLRPEKVGGRTRLMPKAGASSGRKSFQKYLRFMYAMTGTAHNTQELPVTAATIQPGDFFIEPSPSVQVLGHALIVLDVAVNARGQIKAVIAQGYTPARDLHLLKAPDGSAWFTLDPSAPVTFPSWGNPFAWTQLMRFRN